MGSFLERKDRPVDPVYIDEPEGMPEYLTSRLGAVELATVSVFQGSKLPECFFQPPWRSTISGPGVRSPSKSPRFVAFLQMKGSGKRLPRELHHDFSSPGTIFISIGEW